MSRRHPLVAALFVLVAALASQPDAARAATLLVPQDVPTIQGAIDLAVDGDTVLVAPGVYEENINFLGKAITVTSTDGPELTRIHAAEIGSVVKFVSGEGRGSILRGLTLSDGQFATQGGGILVLASSPTIEGNRIFGNAACSGGGIHVENGAPIIKNNVVRSNFEQHCFQNGGAAGIQITHTSSAAAGFTSPMIVGNLIADNRGSLQHSIVNIVGPSTPVVAGNLIVRNLSFGLAAIHVQTAQVAMMNNTITDIELASGFVFDWSAGLSLDSVGSGSVFLNNNISNKSDLPAVQCVSVDLAAVVWQSNNVYSAGGVGYDVGCADQTGVNGNLSTDPEFARFARGDYRLRPLSALVDAGTLGHPGVPAVDFDGLTRVFDGNGDGIAEIDIGAFETQGDPIADAGPNLFPSSSEIVVLDGRNSFDPEGGALTYLWHLDGLEVGTQALVALGPLNFGTHRARLTVTDETGNSNADEVTLTVLPPNNELPLVDVPPSVLFIEGGTMTATFGPTPVDPDGTVVSYLWTLNDVVVGTEETVTLAPLDNRDHIIEFTVTDNSGGSVTATILGIVLPDQPLARAGPNQSVRVGETVVLDGSLSSDSGEALTYSWTLDGVEFATTEIATVNGLDIGTYDFVLTVADPGGWAASDSTTVTVLPANEPPVANAGPDLAILTLDEATLDGSGSSDPDGDPLTYAWSLNGAQIATGPMPTVGPFPAGSHSVVLTVTDTSGASASDTLILTVENRAPLANAGVDLTILTLNTVMLDGSSSSDPEGDALTYSWSLNGAQIATGPTPTVGPFEDGFYTITLTVTDPFGASASDSMLLTVLNQEPVADAGPDQTAAPTTGPTASVTLDGSASLDPDGSIVSYLWTRDGAPVGSGATLQLSLGRGTYSFTLTVTDDDGASASDSTVVTVVNGPPRTTFTQPLDGQTFTDGTAVDVVVEAIDPDGSVANVQLYLNGAFVRQENRAPYEWPANRDGALRNLGAGTHVLTARATDSEGAVAETSITITVEAGTPSVNQPPQVSFAQPLDGEVFPEGSDLFVVVDAFDSDGSIANVRLFLNGAFVRQENRAPYEWPATQDPVFQNMAAGSYTLTAIATDDQGATTETSITISVTGGSGGI